MFEAGTFRQQLGPREPLGPWLNMSAASLLDNTKIDHPAYGDMSYGYE
jgi:hypothetical protein